MPNWKELLNEVQAGGSQHDIARRKYLLQLHDLTGRNTIVYYSGWQQKTGVADKNPELFTLNDQDRNGFMAAIHKMDRKKGLDLVLHTPGGGIAATEALVDYLRAMFDGDVRAIVPQIAMSAGTMLALACKSIVMGKHSNLGPIDPQIGGVPAHGVIEEFERAKKEIKADPSCIPLWQIMIGKYPPAFVQRCEKAIDWSDTLVREWLQTGMFAGDTDAEKKATRIVDELGKPATQKVHDRHVAVAKLVELGIHVEVLEDNPKLQDAVLTVHHACILTLTFTPACKIIENHAGVAFMHTLVGAT